MTDTEVKAPGAIEIGPTELITAQVAQQPRSPMIQGTPIEALGKTWLLPPLGLAEGVRKQRDAIYNLMVAHEVVETSDIIGCAYVMLQVNYHLTSEETAAILKGADRAELVDIVVENVLFGEIPAFRETYTDWARTALLANGLDPKKIDRADLAGVLRHLVAAGRAMPHAEFTAMGKFRSERDNILG